MSLWYNLELNDKRVMVQQTAEREGIHELAVEKDWWVTIVLKALFNCSCKAKLLFKGGTSLSKGWDIVYRFSEDIDIALDRSFFKINGDNKSQRDRLRKISRKYIQNELMIELKQNIICFLGDDDFEIEFVESKDSDADPSVINIYYKSILDQNIVYIRNAVKVEISCLSLSDPNEWIVISSLINKNNPKVDYDSSSKIKTVLPLRTFLEKIFLLHEEFQKMKPRHDKMSRHLYDLERLMKKDYIIQSLNNMELYNEIIAHREKFYALKYVDYSLHSPKFISIIPPIDNYKDWENDYAEMRKSFIYGDSLSFDELIERIRGLEEMIHKLETQ